MVLFQQGDFVSGGNLTTSGDISGCQNSAGWLVGGYEERPSRSPRTARVTQPQMSTELELRHPALWVPFPGS